MPIKYLGVASLDHLLIILFGEPPCEKNKPHLFTPLHSYKNYNRSLYLIRQNDSGTRKPDGNDR